MQGLIRSLPFIGCIAMFVLCARMMSHHGSSAAHDDKTDAAELARLRAEVNELKAQRDQQIEDSSHDSPSR